MRINHAQLSPEVHELLSAKGLSDNVSRLVSSQNVRESDISGLKLFLDKVTITFDMFCALIKYMILGSMESSLTVTEEMHG